MKKKWLFLLLALCALAVLYVCLVNSGYFRKASTEPVLDSDIKVGTVNICGFRYLGQERLTAEMLLATAAREDFDILLLQEYTSSTSMSDDDFRSLFGEVFPHISIAGEFAVCSKIPVTEHRTVHFADRSDSYASIMFGDGEEAFRLLSIHLRTTGLFYFKNGKAISNTGDASNMLNLLKENKKIRVAQANSLQNIITATAGKPLVVAGDFNSLPMSKVYRTIKGRALKDCFREKGTGKGSTYRMMKDLFRIDCIMHNDTFKCIDCSILGDNVSDHRIVKATLRAK